MVEGCATVYQTAHDLGMTEMGRRDESGSVIGAGDEIGAVAKPDCQGEQVRIVGDRCDRDHVVGLVFKRVHVGARGCQSL